MFGKITFILPKLILSYLNWTTFSNHVKDIYIKISIFDMPYLGQFLSNLVKFDLNLVKFGSNSLKFLSILLFLLQIWSNWVKVGSNCVKFSSNLVKFGSDNVKFGWPWSNSAWGPFVKFGMMPQSLVKFGMDPSPPLKFLEIDQILSACQIWLPNLVIKLGN